MPIINFLLSFEGLTSLWQRYFYSLEIFFFSSWTFPSFVCVFLFYFVANNINNLESHFLSMFIYYRIYTFLWLEFLHDKLLFLLHFAFLYCVYVMESVLFIDLNSFSFCLIIIFFFFFFSLRSLITVQ